MNLTIRQHVAYSCPYEADDFTVEQTTQGTGDVTLLKHPTGKKDQR